MEQMQRGCNFSPSSRFRYTLPPFMTWKLSQDKEMPRIFWLLAVIALTACAPSERDIQELVQRHLDYMVFVEGGSFMMGNPGGWDTSPNSWPPHKVTLDSFYIQKYEVTNRDFDLFRKATGYVSSSPRYKGFYQENKPHFAPKLPAIAS